MATNILVEQATEQNIQILQFRNQKLSEQLASLKEQIKNLEGSVSKHDEEKKQYADTMLCVGRIWNQLNADVQSLCVRCAGSTANPAVKQEDAGAGAATKTEEQEEEEELEAWEAFDPYLRRLLANNEAVTAADRKSIKRSVQDYQHELSDVEQTLHQQATASLQALSQLLQQLQQRTEAANQQLERLRQLPADEALKKANQQLQDEADSLRQQLDAAQALQRATQARIKQCEDKAFEAVENLKSIKNDLADKEYALQAAQRKLQRLKQQQGDPAAAGLIQGLAMQASCGDAAAGTSNAAAAVAAAAAGQGGGAAAGNGAEDLQVQVGCLLNAVTCCVAVLFLYVSDKEFLVVQ